MQGEAVAALEEIGLSANEAKVYSALVELGSCAASEAAARAGIDRSVAYTVLGRLIAKGLASYVIKGGTRFFSPAPPERLLDFVAEKEERAKAIIPVLRRVRPKAEEEETVEVFRGNEGLKGFYDEVLRDGKDLFNIGYTARGPHYLPYYSVLFERRRAKAGIRRFIVTAENRRKLMEAQDLKLCEARYIPGKLLETPISTAFYGNKARIIFAFKHEPVIIRIESEDLVRTYMNYFKLLWKMARK